MLVPRSLNTTLLGRWCLAIGLFLFCSPAQAVTADSARVLSPEAFLGIVQRYHPVIRAAGLDVARADAELLSARGAFDPVASAGLDRKSFDGKLYYSYFNPQLSLPTWYGLEFKGGIEEVIGDRVNPQATLGRTSYAGVKVAANGIFFDQRRATLRQAQSLVQQSLAERRNAVNDVLYDAMAAYWQWWQAHQTVAIVREGLQVAEERMRFVVQEYEDGLRAAIDTVEAQIQFQGFQNESLSAALAVQKTGLELANFLWLENGTPVGWDGNVVPAAEGLPGTVLPPLAEFLENLNEHPKLQAFQFKAAILRTDQLLKTQYLLPKLSVNANLLGKGYGFPTPADASPRTLENNYKLAVDFSLPLLLRTARGNVIAARLKVDQTLLQRDAAALELENKVRAYYTEVLTLRQQYQLYAAMYAGQTRLTNGERVRFEGGESTLFLLNARQSKLLEIAQKMQEARAKLGKAEAALFWSAGLLR